MQKIILDTNVLVSALWSPDKDIARILDEIVFEEKVETCLSMAILAEYEDVLSREKFAARPNWSERAARILDTLNAVGTFYKPIEKLSLIKDEPDNRFAELALEANADFLITGNSRDFTMDRIGQTRIINPKVFYEGFMAGFEE